MSLLLCKPTYLNAKSIEMTNTSYGPEMKTRALKLLEVLMQEAHEEANKKVLLQDKLEQPYLQIEKARLADMVEWSSRKLSIEQIRAAIQQHLEVHLKIISDLEISRGANAVWSFKLKLWSTDLNENREQFEKAWEKPQSSSDAVIQKPEILETCRKNIEPFLKMRLFNNPDKIEVNQLYVDVFLLSQACETKQIMASDCAKKYDYDRDCFDGGKRIPGNEVVENNTKLIIIGKPGSGKTTFIKYLANDWYSKKSFYSDLFAVLIEFRAIRRSEDGEWSLMYEIGNKLGLENDAVEMENLKKELRNLQKEFQTWQAENNHRISQLEKEINNLSKQKLDDNDKKIEKLKKEGQLETLNKEQDSKRKDIKAREERLKSLPLEIILEQGKLLLLMDGLDEVAKNELRESVKSQIYELAQEYPKNPFILTCRLKIIEIPSVPYDFTLVEVADFNREQVEQFVKNYFKTRGKSDEEANQKYQTFNQMIGENQALSGLTFTPVLLILICLLLENNTVWENNIPKNDINYIYRRAIDLLLNGWNDDKSIDGWEFGSQKYQKLSKEQKKDLLIKLAVDKFVNPINFLLWEEQEIIYNIQQFLSIQEEKEAKGILKAIESQHGLLIQRADALWAFSHLTLQEHFTIEGLIRLPSDELAEKVIDLKWQIAVKRLVNQSPQPLDRFVRLIKRAVDHSIRNESNLQNFLDWVFQQSNDNIQEKYKLTAIRALYFALPVVELTRAIEFAIVCDSSLKFDLDFSFEQEFNDTTAIEKSCNKIHQRIDEYKNGIERIQSLIRTLDPSLANKLENIRKSLPNSSIKDTVLYQWFITDNGMKWQEEVRQLMEHHRNIYSQQLNDQEKQKLLRYYKANKFLVEVINIQRAVSDNLRSQIEETLLLPWERILDQTTDRG
jgi:predicted NACHT family NTPase